MIDMETKISKKHLNINNIKFEENKEKTKDKTSIIAEKRENKVTFQEIRELVKFEFQVMGFGLLILGIVGFSILNFEKPLSILWGFVKIVNIVAFVHITFTTPYFCSLTPKFINFNRINIRISNKLIIIQIIVTLLFSPVILTDFDRTSVVTYIYTIVIMSIGIFMFSSIFIEQWIEIRKETTIETTIKKKEKKSKTKT